MSAATCTIRRATSAADIDAARALFEEYAAALDFELRFQDFQAELNTLPGAYAPPTGDLLLAEMDGDVVGCVAVRQLDEGVCEMKRLYVRPGFRRHGIGRALAVRIVGRGRALGYQTMRLDTVETMHAARALYRDLGFRETDAYYHNPLPDVVYMEREL